MKKVTNLLLLCVITACSNAMLYNDRDEPDYKTIMRINDIPVTFEAYIASVKHDFYDFYVVIEKQDYPKYENNKISLSDITKGMNDLYEHTCKGKGQKSVAYPPWYINDEKVKGKKRIIATSRCSIDF